VGWVYQPSMALAGMGQRITSRGAYKMEPQTFTLARSPFAPIALGFFGLGVVGMFQFITGIWLMYCTYAITVNLALGAKAWI
jgi:hypothetical protein